MKFQEFQTGMLRLGRTYGVSGYPQERVNLFWGELEKFDGAVFYDAVTELIANELKPPMLRQILAAVDEEIKRSARRPTHQVEPVPNYERSAETKAMLADLFARMGGKPQPTDDEIDRHEKLKQQLRVVDWKEKQAGEKGDG